MFSEGLYITLFSKRTKFAIFNLLLGYSGGEKGFSLSLSGSTERTLACAPLYHRLGGAYQRFKGMCAVLDKNLTVLYDNIPCLGSMFFCFIYVVITFPEQMLTFWIQQHKSMWFLECDWLRIFSVLICSSFQLSFFLFCLICFVYFFVYDLF